MKQRIFMLLAAMLLGSASAFAQSGNNEPLKGDVNGDGKVDFADITAVIKIMKDGGGTSEETIYYWYVGHENPMEMTNITPLPSNDVSEGPGWRTIGKTLPTYTKESPLWNSTVISTASTKSTQYMALPSSNIKSRNAISGEDNTDEAWNNIGSKQLNGVIYTIYSSLNIKKSFADLLY